jgi:putative ABC transport system permease protein
MRFSTFIFRNVLRRPIRSTLTITGMAVAVIAVVSLVGLASGLKQSMLSLYEDRGVSLIVTKAGTVNPLTGTMKATVAAETAKLPGVADTCAGLVDFMTVEECGSDPIGIQGWLPGNYMFRELKILHGENLSDLDTGKNNVVIGNTLASVKKLQVGQTITINGEKFHIQGVFESSQDLENGMVVMLLANAQEVLGKSGMMTGCTVIAKDTSPEGVAALRAQIEGPVAEKCGMAGQVLAKSPKDFVQQNNQVRMVTAFAWMTSSVALIIGGIGVLNTMFMSVFERTREIGILRAIGWRPSRVMKMILWESVLLSIGGGVIGTAGGLGLIVLLSHFPAVSGVVHAAISPGIVIEGFAIAIFVGIAGAAYPAYRGSRLLPTEALRHE